MHVNTVVPFHPPSLSIIYGDLPIKKVNLRYIEFSFSGSIYVIHFQVMWFIAKFSSSEIASRKGPRKVPGQ